MNRREQKRAARGLGALGWVSGGALAACVAWVGVACGCGGTKSVRDVRPAVAQDVPLALAGTIGSEASIRGTEATPVSGLGVVVGLNGTGGGDLPESVRATMEREVARLGIGKGSSSVGGGPLEGVTPGEFLRSPNVAVVIVEAAIPPGAPEGTPFDVFVRTLPGSSAVSLEGGTLWTTDLRIGPASVFGAVKTRRLGEARGPIYVNPFSEPERVGEAGEVLVSRNRGRVLDGGRVTDPLRMEIVLDNESHSRSRSVVSAVNSRFPEGAGDRGPTAVGRSGGSIALRVPRAYAKNPGDFLQLLRYARIDQSFPQEAALRYVEALKQQPALAEELGWCLEAVGRTAVPFLAELYDYPELAPRLAVLRAGARLGDPRVVPHLVELARSGAPGLRTEAIQLVGGMSEDPRIDVALRELVNSPDLEVRAAAYEGLSNRNDPTVARWVIGNDPVKPKFVLDALPCDEAMVYVTQQGTPRVVIFGGLGPGWPRMVTTSARVSPGQSARAGGGVRLSRPVFLSAWSDRLMMTGGVTGDVRLRYREARTNRVTETTAPEDVLELVRFLAHSPTPEDPTPGLGLSYSEVVGALYEMTRQGVIPAVFATEEDRLRARIFEASRQAQLADRPENSEGEDGRPTDPVTVFAPLEPGVGSKAVGDEKDADRAVWRPAKIVPLTPRNDGNKAGEGGRRE